MVQARNHGVGGRSSCVHKAGSLFSGIVLLSKFEQKLLQDVIKRLSQKMIDPKPSFHSDCHALKNPPPLHNFSSVLFPPPFTRDAIPSRRQCVTFFPRMCDSRLHACARNSHWGLRKQFLHRRLTFLCRCCRRREDLYYYCELQQCRLNVCIVRAPRAVIMSVTRACLKVS